MKYRLECNELADIGEMLNTLGESANYVASMSLYEGARVLADAVSAEAKNIQTEPFHYAAVPGVTYRLPSPEEKEIVTNSGAMGIAKFEKKGNGVETSIGYNGSGYAPVNWNHMNSKARTNYKSVSFKGRDITASSTLKWLRDQGGSAKYGISATIGRGAQDMKPIGVIANAINSGTSFMKKQPFFRKAVNKSKGAAVDAIVKMANRLFSQIISDNEAGGKSA